MHNRLGSSLRNIPPTSSLRATGREPEKADPNVRGTFGDLHNNVCFVAERTGVSREQSHSSCLQPRVLESTVTLPQYSRGCILNIYEPIAWAFWGLLCSHIKEGFWPERQRTVLYKAGAGEQSQSLFIQKKADIIEFEPCVKQSAKNFAWSPASNSIDGRRTSCFCST